MAYVLVSLHFDRATHLFPLSPEFHRCRDICIVLAGISKRLKMLVFLFPTYAHTDLRFAAAFIARVLGLC
jgi:hypothetical protein